MQLGYMFLRFLGKVAILDILLLFVSLKYTQTTSWGYVLLQVLAVSLLSLGALALDEVYLYPNFRSPLRHLPSVTVNAGYNARLITEVPRGKSALRWAIEQPDADLINSKGKLGQSVLYPIGPEALRDVMSTNCYDFEKPWGLRAYLSRFIGWGLITLEGQRHREKRKSLHTAFNIKHIRALYPTMWQKANLLLEVMDQEMRENGRLDVTVCASRYALDVIGVAALSREFNALTSEDHPIAKAFSTVLDPAHFMVQHMALMIGFEPALVERMPSRANRLIDKAARFLRASCEDILDQTRANLAEKDVKPKQNILSTIIGNRDLESDEIVDHMLTFIAAGHETTASSLSWACHLLTFPENHHYQNLLREEIRSALPHHISKSGQLMPDFTVDASTLQNPLETLPYLNGICEEVLRLFPPVPATLREAIRQTTIAGTTVPRGTLLVVMPWAINRNPRYWGKDADKMRPERWIDFMPDASRRFNKHGGAVSNYCEMTFLHGGHACIGRDFAKSELKIALAAIFGQFELRRLPGDTGEKVRIQGTLTTKPLGGLKLTASKIPYESRL